MKYKAIHSLKMAKTKPKSKVWIHCDLDQNNICKYCGFKMYKNITKFHQHLKTCKSFIKDNSNTDSILDEMR